MKRLFVIGLCLVIISIFAGCSGGNGTNVSDEMVLSTLSAIDSYTIEASFNNGTNVTITDFSPQPLVKDKTTKVSFLYNGSSYSGEVYYEDIFNGTINKINTGLIQNGSISIVNAEISDQVNASSFSGNYRYISGLSTSNKPVIKEVNADSYEEKVVLFNDVQSPPAAHPSAFALDNTKYLLFGYDTYLRLYEHVGSNDTNSRFNKVTDMWDFSRVESFIEAKEAVIMTPEYNDTLKTLFFSLSYHSPSPRFEDGDYYNVSLFKSTLDTETGEFNIPTKLEGEIDPYNAIHYIDNQEHDVNDFEHSGFFWLGRMYVTDDGTKAYFNYMNVGATPESGLKPGDPYIAAIPNNQYIGDYDVTGVRDPKIIWNSILSVEIDPTTGEFYNVQQLSSAINRGGINFICDVSPDGKKLYVAHMNLDEEYWSIPDEKAPDPDGMVHVLSKENTWDVPAWDGDIEEVILYN